MKHSTQTTPKWTKETNLYCILTNLADCLWSIVNVSFARHPVVSSQLHCILQQETNPSWQLLVGC